MSGPYTTVVADPPWPMAWRGGAARRRNGRGELHISGVSAVKSLPYPTMTIDEIAALHVPAAADAHLYLWTVDRFLLDGSAARVVEAWGFSPPRLLVWKKSGFGLGTFPRPQHEICLVSRRGSLGYAVRNEGSVHEWPIVYERRGRSVARKHSAKPPAFFDLVERASPGPYLEMFARSQRLNWDSWGDEALQHVEIG